MLNQRGFSLIQVMVAMAIAGILMYAVVTQMTSMQSSNQVIKMQMTRDHLIREAVLRLSHLPTIEKSALLSENSEFLACRDGAAPSGTACQSKSDGKYVDHDLTLVSSTGNGVISTGKGRPYDASGASCGGDNAAAWESNTDCAFKLVTGFQASCAGGADFCAVAESIEFFYRVEVASKIQNMPVASTKGNLPYAPLNTDAEAAGSAPNIGRMACTDSRCCFDMGTVFKCIATGDSPTFFGFAASSLVPGKSKTIPIPAGKYVTAPKSARSLGKCLGALTAAPEVGDDCMLIGEICGGGTGSGHGGSSNSHGQAVTVLTCKEN